MTRLRCWRPTLLILIVLVLWGSSCLAAGRGLFYVVRSPLTTAYLFGSVHLGRSDFYPLPQQVEQAFARSDLLVLEVDPAAMSSAAVRQQMEAGALYSPGDSIRNHLPPSLYERVVREAGGAGLPVEALARMRPWMLALTLQMIVFQRQGYSAEQGIEAHFLRLGGGGKPIRELESADFQVRLLSGFSEQEQELFLQDTLRALSDRTVVEEMMRAWREGDAAALERAIMQPLAEHPETRPIYRKLFFDRNRGMADRIEGLLKGARRPFVVVGSGHLVGPEGVVELLRRRGYRVEQQ